MTAIFAEYGRITRRSIPWPRSQSACMKSLRIPRDIGTGKFIPARSSVTPNRTCIINQIFFCVNWFLSINLNEWQKLVAPEAPAGNVGGQFHANAMYRTYISSMIAG